MIEKWTAQRVWVTDRGSIKSLEKKQVGDTGENISKKHVLNKKDCWGIAKPRKNLIPEPEPKANPVALLLPPCRPSTRPCSAFQERGRARCSRRPLPERLPHAGLPALPTLLPAASGTSRLTQTAPRERLRSAPRLRIPSAMPELRLLSPVLSVTLITLILLLQVLLGVVPLPSDLTTASLPEQGVAFNTTAQN